MSLSINDQKNNLAELTRRTTRRIIDRYNALPWWKRLNNSYRAIAKDAINQCWRECSKAQAEASTIDRMVAILSQMEG